MTEVGWVGSSPRSSVMPAILRISWVNTTQIPAETPIHSFYIWLLASFGGWKPLPAAAGGWGWGGGSPDLIPTSMFLAAAQVFRIALVTAISTRAPISPWVFLAAVSNPRPRLLALCVVRILGNVFLCKCRQRRVLTCIHPSVHLAFSCHFFPLRET